MRIIIICDPQLEGLGGVPFYLRAAQVNPFGQGCRVCQNLLHRTRRFPHGDCPQEAGIHD
jgi:hypothetical protein